MIQSCLLSAELYMKWTYIYEAYQYLFHETWPKEYNNKRLSNGRLVLNYIKKVETWKRIKRRLASRKAQQTVLAYQMTVVKGAFIPYFGFWNLKSKKLAPKQTKRALAASSYLFALYLSFFLSLCFLIRDLGESWRGSRREEEKNGIEMRWGTRISSFPCHHLIYSLHHLQLQLHLSVSFLLSSPPKPNNHPIWLLLSSRISFPSFPLLLFLLPLEKKNEKE